MLRRSAAFAIMMVLLCALVSPSAASPTADAQESGRYSIEDISALNELVETNGASGPLLQENGACSKDEAEQWGEWIPQSDGVYRLAKLKTTISSGDVDLSGLSRLEEIELRGEYDRLDIHGLDRLRGTRIGVNNRLLSLDAHGCASLRDLNSLVYRPINLGEAPRFCELNLQGCVALQTEFGIRLANRDRSNRLTVTSPSGHTLIADLSAYGAVKDQTSVTIDPQTEKIWISGPGWEKAVYVRCEPAVAVSDEKHGYTPGKTFVLDRDITAYIWTTPQSDVPVSPSPSPDSSPTASDSIAPSPSQYPTATAPSSASPTALPSSTPSSGSSKDMEIYRISADGRPMSAGYVARQHGMPGTAETICLQRTDGSVVPRDAKAGSGNILTLKDEDGKPVAEKTVVVVGDVSGTGVVNITSLVQTARLLAEGAPSERDLAACDASGNGTLDISDLVQLAKWLPNSSESVLTAPPDFLYDGAAPQLPSPSGDSADIVYREDVVVSSGREIEEKGATLEMPADEARQLSEGDVLVVDDTSAYKIRRISFDDDKAVVDYDTPDLRDFLTSLEVEGTGVMDFANFVPAEGVRISDAPGELRGKLGDISFEKELRVDDDWTLKFSLKETVEDVRYKLDMDFYPSPRVHTAFVEVPQTAVLSAQLSASTNDLLQKNDLNRHVFLGSVPIAGVKGLELAVDLELIMKARGTFDISYSISGPIGFTVNENRVSNTSYLTGSLEANVAGEMQMGPRLSLAAKVFGQNLLSLSAEIGINAEGAVNRRPTGLVCMDGNLTLYASASALKDTLLDKWLGLGMERTIWDKESSPVQVRRHFENMKIVDSCSYPESLPQETSPPGVDEPPPISEMPIVPGNDRDEEFSQRRCPPVPAWDEVRVTGLPSEAEFTIHPCDEPMEAMDSPSGVYDWKDVVLWDGEDYSTANGGRPNIPYLVCYAGIHCQGNELIGTQCTAYIPIEDVSSVSAHSNSDGRPMTCTYENGVVRVVVSDYQYNADSNICFASFSLICSAPESEFKPVRPSIFQIPSPLTVSGLTERYLRRMKHTWKDVDRLEVRDADGRIRGKDEIVRSGDVLVPWFVYASEIYRGKALKIIIGHSA